MSTKQFSNEIQIDRILAKSLLNNMDFNMTFPVGIRVELRRTFDQTSWAIV